MLGTLHEKDSSKGYDILALQYAELSKSRVFLDLLAESLAKVNEGADKELTNKQEAIFTDLTLAKKQKEQESLNAQPDIQHPQTVSLEEVQTTVPR